MFLSRVPSSTTAWTWPGAGAQGTGDFDGRAAFTALSQRDGIGAALVRERLPRRPLGGVERRARGALASLRPELRFADARAGDQFHQLQRELVGDEFVMGKLGLLVGGTHALLRAAGVPAPHRLAPHDPALAHRVRPPA